MKASDVHSVSIRKQFFGALVCVWLVAACSNGQQIYSTSQFAPPEPTKRLSKGDGDAQGQKSVSVGEQTGSVVISGSNVQAVGERMESEEGLSELFLASKVVSHESSFEMASSRVTSKVSMTRVEGPKTVSMIQPTRENVVDVFSQGGSGQKIVEEASQSSAKGALDILIVVDDSGSMAEEQKNLSNKLEPLLSEISSSDWKIGVITTSRSQSNLRAVISRGDTNADEVFKLAVTPGTGGDGTERGIYQAVQGLKSPGFLRPGSSVAVLIVSDEDNCSTGEDNKNCKNESSRFASYLTDYLSQNAGRELKTQARVYGLTWMPGTECNVARNIGNVYAQAIEASGGRGGSICAQDYTTTLKEISLNVKSILQNSWSLKHVPDAGSLKVFLDDVEVKSGFSLAGNFVTFTQVPAPNVKIRFEYNVGAKPMLTSFRLSQKPHPGSLSILVNGVDIENGYSLAASDPQLLVLDKTAPEFSTVKVSYKKDSILPSTFVLQGSVKPNSVSVKVNGNDVSHLYDAQLQTVSLSEAPAEGATIGIGYVELGAAILDYPFDFSSAEMSNLAAIDSKTLLPLTVRFDPNQGLLSFQPSDFADGREVLVSFDDARTLGGVFALPQVPLAGSVRIVDANGGAICEQNGSFVVESNKLSLNCGIAPGERFAVTYRSLTDVKTQFQVTGLPKDQCEEVRWEIRVNGLEGVVPFNRVGCSFTALSALPPEAKILISAIPGRG